MYQRRGTGAQWARSRISSLIYFRGDLSVPEEGDWCTVGLVEKLYLYPVKSLAHIQGLIKENVLV